MTRGAIAVAILALALLTFFQFPGHTYLQQDSQIYVPILDRLHDPALFRNEILAQQPHVSFTLYDEVALALRRVTGAAWSRVLGAQQIATRALGIWGVYLLAASLGLSAVPALLVAAVVSLGASIAGPSVLTFEYEPTPRAFALPLVVCAAGLMTKRRFPAASIAASAAFLYHAPTAIPFCVVFVAVLAIRKEWRSLIPLLVAAMLLFLAARAQSGSGEEQSFFARLDPLQEQLQRMRTAYVWVSTWRPSWIFHHLLLFSALLAAFARVRREVSFEARMFLVILPAAGLLSMPISWILLERWHWGLVPQVQPLRTLLFGTLAFQLLAATAAVKTIKSGRIAESALWFAAAFLLPLQPILTLNWTWRSALLALALGSVTALLYRRDPRLALAPALAAFFLIPALGGVVNYPRLHTPEIAQLADWARASTPADAVFLFPDAGRALYPGIFRAQALRAVYVDWKGGGQVNYLRSLGEQWWFRWQQTMASGFRASDLAKYPGLGISYVVLRAPNRLPRPPVFENAAYTAYATQ